MDLKLDIQKFEEFISQYPVYEYRILDTKELKTEERVRIICRQECERYGTTWACPPAVGTLEECGARIHSYEKAVFFSSVAEVSDVLNMEEMLTTRRAHEDLTAEIASFLKKEGFETFTLSTESCDICGQCTYPQGKPCRHPERMHPCLESHGIVASEIVEEKKMEYNLGGNTILWFSMILFRHNQKNSGIN
ncbi:MAG TPA: DUF2284 domain-containing protein [Candidatus Blautia excrementipullorum]|nr:DUF2284 domain-containing protein [Candidatus Blautia excrementipullorum]